MIFVTVGTHEQAFDRLVRTVDDLVANRVIDDDVYVQTGYSTYKPTHCKHSQWVAFQEMSQYMTQADIVITHGGPSSFIEAMAAGKVPVVVPRQSQFNEHVNDHQVEFVRAVAERQGGIIPVYDISELAGAIERARYITSVEYTPHNPEFCRQFQELIEAL